MYELIYILPSDYDDDKIKKANQDIFKAFSNHNGALVKDESLGKKALKYPIKNHKHGQYFLIEFTIPVDHVKALKKDLNLNKNIIKYLLTKKEVKAEEEAKKPRETKEQTSTKKTDKKDYSIIKTEKEQEDESKSEKAKLDQLDEKLKEILE